MGRSLMFEIIGTGNLPYVLGWKRGVCRIDPVVCALYELYDKETDSCLFSYCTVYWQETVHLCSTHWLC